MLRYVPSTSNVARLRLLRSLLAHDVGVETSCLATFRSELLRHIRDMAVGISKSLDGIDIGPLEQYYSCATPSPGSVLYCMSALSPAHFPLGTGGGRTMRCSPQLKLGVYKNATQFRCAAARRYRGMDLVYALENVQCIERGQVHAMEDMLLLQAYGQGAEPIGGHGMFVERLRPWSKASAFVDQAATLAARNGWSQAVCMESTRLFR
eukprot:UN0378